MILHDKMSVHMCRKLRGQGSNFHANTTIIFYLFIFVAIAQNFVSVSVWLSSCNKNSRKDGHKLFGQGPGCYTEKLMVLSIQ